MEPPEQSKITMMKIALPPSIVFCFRTYEGLSFKPFPNFARFEQIRNASLLPKRRAEDERLLELENKTLEDAKEEIELAKFQFNRN